MLKESLMDTAFKNVDVVSLLKTISEHFLKWQRIGKFFNPFRILMERTWIRWRETGQISGQINRVANPTERQQLGTKRNHWG